MQTASASRCLPERRASYSTYLHPLCKLGVASLLGQLFPKESFRQVGFAMASLDKDEPFGQEQLHTDRKQDLRNEEQHEVVRFHIGEELRMVKEELHKVVAKHYREEGHHRVVEIPHIMEATHMKVPQKEKVELHMAEEVAIKMVKPYTQVDIMQVILQGVDLEVGSIEEDMALACLQLPKVSLLQMMRHQLIFHRHLTIQLKVDHPS